MTKEYLTREIRRENKRAFQWTLALNHLVFGGYVVGYFYNELLKSYVVYSTQRTGRIHFYGSVETEIKALQELLDIVQFQAKITRQLAKQERESA